MRATPLAGLVLVAACDSGEPPPAGPTLAQVVQGELIPDRALVTSVGIDQTPTNLEEENTDAIAGTLVASVSGTGAGIASSSTSGTGASSSSGTPAPNQPGPGELGGVGDWTASVTLEPGSPSAQIGRIWLHPPYENIEVNTNPFDFSASSVVTAQGLAADWEDTTTSMVYCTPYVPTAAFRYSRVGAGDVLPPPQGLPPVPGIEYESKLYFTGHFTAFTAPGSVPVTKLIRYDSGGPEFRTISNTRGVDGDDNPGPGILFNGSLFLPLNDTATDNALKLWRYNATDEQLREVIDIQSGGNEAPQDLTVVAGELYWSAQPGSGDRAIYRYSESPDRTPIAVNLVTSPTSFQNPGNLVELNGLLCFQAIGPNSTRKVWAYVPSNNTIRRISDINPGASDEPTSLTSHGGKLYFVAEEPTGQREMYVYDPNVGANGETRKLLDVFPSPGSDDPQGLTVSDGGLYFSATVAQNVRKLFRYDFATNTHRQVSDTNTSTGTDAPAQITPYGDGVLFTGPDVFGNNQLFHFSTSANVVRTVTSHLNNVIFVVTQIAPWGNWAVFVGGDATNNIRKLYLYDGVGISQMADLAGPTNTDNIVIIGPYGNSLAFSGGPAANNASLYLLTPG
jgi:ELWxxDGT repeat protein